MYAGLTRMVRDEFGRRPLETGRQSAFTGYWGFSGARTPAYVIVSVRPSSVVSVEFALRHCDVLKMVFNPTVEMLWENISRTKQFQLRSDCIEDRGHP